MKVWQSLATRKIPWTRPTEVEEGVHRICEWVYALQIEHAWDCLIIAKDTSRYWRHEVVEAFNASLPRFTDPLTGLFYVKYDGVVQQIVDSTSPLVKLPSAESKKLMKTVIETMDAPAHPLNLYKGNRRSENSWTAETPIDVFYTLRDRLADRVALLTKGKVVGFKSAEADDIAAVVATVTKGSGKTVTLISGDGDWNQLLLQGTHVRFHDIYHGSKIEFSEELQKEVSDGLKVKIIGGDTGDNIKGVPYSTGKAGCIAQAGAEKHVEAGLGVEIFDTAYLLRNAKLMMLSQSQIPVEIWDGILASMSQPQKVFSSAPLSWADLGLNDKERERIEVSGGAARIFATWKNAPAKLSTALKGKSAVDPEPLAPEPELAPEPLAPEPEPEVREELSATYRATVITGGSGIEEVPYYDPVSGEYLEKNTLPF